MADIATLEINVRADGAVRSLNQLADAGARAAKGVEQVERIQRQVNQAVKQFGADAGGGVRAAQEIGREQAKALLAGFELQHRLDKARIKDAQSQGFISAAEAREAGRRAAESYNDGVKQTIREQERLGTVNPWAPGGGTGAQLRSYLALADNFKNVDAASRSAGIGMGQLRESLGSFAAQAAHAHPITGRLANVIGGFAIGSTATVAALAGIAAIGFAWNELTKDARALRDAVEESTRSIQEQARLSASMGDSAIIDQLAPLYTQRDNLARRLREEQQPGIAGSLAGAFLSLFPGMGLAGARNAATAQLEQQIAEITRVIEKGDSQLRTRQSERQQKALEEARQLSEKFVADTVQLLRAEEAALLALVEAGQASGSEIEKLVQKQYEYTSVLLDGNRTLAERHAALQQVVASERALGAEWERQRDLQMAIGNGRIRARGMAGLALPQSGAVTPYRPPNAQEEYDAATGKQRGDALGDGIRTILSSSGALGALGAFAGAIIGVGNAAAEGERAAAALDSALRRMNREMSGSSLDAALAEVKAQANETIRQITAATDIGQPGRESAITNVSNWRRMREQQLRDQFAFSDTQRMASLGSRSMRARGLDGTADLQDLITRQGAELFEAIQRKATDAELATIAAVQAEERLALTRRQAEEEVQRAAEAAAEAARRAAENLRSMQDLSDRLYVAMGGDGDARSIQRLQEREIADALAAGRDSSYMTLLNEVLAAELKLWETRRAEAEALAQAERALQSRDFGRMVEMLAAEVGGDEMTMLRVRETQAMQSQIEAAQALVDQGIIAQDMFDRFVDLLGQKFINAINAAEQAIEAAAQAAERARQSIQSSIEIDLLRATGNEQEAQRRQFLNEWAERFNEAMRAGIDPETERQLYELRDRGLANLINQSSGGGIVERGLPNRRDPNVELTRSIAGITETTAIRMVDIQRSQLGVLQMIELNTRHRTSSSGGGLTVNLNGGIVVGSLQELANKLAPYMNRSLGEAADNEDLYSGSVA
jgi:hypothetical protein